MERKKISGNPGSLAPPEPPANPPPPAAAPERTASLVERNGRLYAVIGNSEFPLDATSAALAAGRRPPGPRTAESIPSDLAAAVEAAAQHREALMAIPGVVAVRAGYLFRDGVITDAPCIVVAVDRPGTPGIPAALSSFPIDVTLADPFERLNAAAAAEAAPAIPQPRLLIDEIQHGASEAAFLEALPVTTYQPPPDGNLDAVTGPMTVTCHVSPDAGWKVLKPFLESAERSIQLGMYDFTAPHIYDAARSLLRGSGVEWRQVLDPKVALPAEDDVDSTKADDKTEESVVRGLRRAGGERFSSAFAQIGSGRTFASAYHIKVAVRDQKAFWLSSGNWQSSNQPDIDFLDASADRRRIPEFNREWHVVIENAPLARRFQRFLEADFETASTQPEAAVLEAAAPLPGLLVPAESYLEERAAADLQVFPPERFVFPPSQPLTVQPILTPDNYLDVVLDFLRRKPRHRLYFQNQSLNPIKDPTPQYAELLRLLAQYSRDEDLDVRIIFRNIGPIRKKLESLQAAGFNMRRVKVQAGCHTKGIIVDSETVLLGSHNITNQGVEVNRDASLLIHHSGIARYFERVFLHDWEKLSRFAIRQEATPLPESAPAGGGAEAAPAPDLYVRIPFASYLEE